ncbi:hypothetical protein [uncultured Maritimibacter sp.]|jgi:TRAP-type C4-dicarboxylate transport system substrate-binding protein|uniref:hypothetical protein n=1 Tax=uncultured Maritimibacter sp. TaxID=991866 RepID=UPI002634147F|nr:hypothetical protein [uncultured Maritimibacter sp.]
MKIFRTSACVAALLLATVSARAEQVDILLNNFVPPSFLMYSVLPDWGRKVEEVTEGRVRIAIPAGSLAPLPEQRTRSRAAFTTRRGSSTVSSAIASACRSWHN